MLLTVKVKYSRDAGEITSDGLKVNMISGGLPDSFKPLAFHVTERYHYFSAVVPKLFLMDPTLIYKKISAQVLCTYMQLINVNQAIKNYQDPGNHTAYLQ